jgi:Domain of unknown function (DUF4282)
MAQESPSSRLADVTPLSSLLLDIKPPPGQPPARSFLLFDWMVTPILIRVAYVIGSSWWIYQSLKVMFSKDDGLEQLARMTGQNAPSQFWDGLLMLVLGLVGIRVACESMIVLYRLHDNVRAIRDRGGTSIG